MPTVYLALGSNLGDRHALLDSAIAHIGQDVGRVKAVSNRYETEPEGFVSSSSFVNAVIEVDTELEPLALLRATQRIECKLGRKTKSTAGQYSDRPIDIDILLYGDQRVETLELTIPHPHISVRRFVLEPLCDVLPDSPLPHIGYTARQLYGRIVESCAHYYISESYDPFYNIALEDYLYHERRDLGTVYMLWVNGPSVFMGRYQSARAETDFAYLEAQGIPVLRRSSGGGTVYHDAGNLNFTCIRTSVGAEGFDLVGFPQPIISAVRSQGIELTLTSPRGDLRYQGLKVGGSAEATRRGRMLYHMSLLFDANLEQLERVLAVPEVTAERSRVPSVRSRVCNIRPLLSEDMDMAGFRSLLLEHIGRQHSELVPIELSEEAEHYISRIRQERYESPEWIHSSIGRK